MEDDTKDAARYRALRQSGAILRLRLDDPEYNTRDEFTNPSPKRIDEVADDLVRIMRGRAVPES